MSKGENIVKWIKRQRVSWLGHLQRMEEDRMPKKIFTQELEGMRRTGRPRKVSKEEIEEIFKCWEWEDGESSWQIGKNGRTLFDRPKPTVGCSANGRRKDNQAVIEAKTISKTTLSQSVIVSRQSLIIMISSDRVQLIRDTGMLAPVNWQNMVLTDNLRRNQDEKGGKIWAGLIWDKFCKHSQMSNQLSKIPKTLTCYQFN